MNCDPYERFGFSRGEIRRMLMEPACGYIFQNPFRHVQKLSKRALKRLGDISAKIIIRSTPRESHRKHLEELEEDQN